MVDRDGFECDTGKRPGQEVLMGVLDRMAATRGAAAVSLAVLAGLTALSPIAAPPALALGIWLSIRSWNKSWAFPLKTPMHLGRPDPEERHPQTAKAQPGRGMFFLGNESSSGGEIWLSENDARQHFLVLGTTGAGKSEALLSFAANALSWGSGFVFTDGKGDVSLYAKVYALCAKFGRLPDFLVLNFMTGADPAFGTPGRRLSLRMNPFRSGSSDSLTQLIVSLMDDVGGDGAMWMGRATAMLAGVMRALCWKRDQGEIQLDVGSIRDHMSLRAIICLADEDENPDMPETIRKSIRSYLTSLPGFREDRAERQAQTTLDQHGYLEMQFCKILGTMADVYGHIFAEGGVDIDMDDVVQNRRILLIMLPALEKSGDEIANLGKIVCGSLKSMMGRVLCSNLTGDWNEVASAPTLRKSLQPFMCIFDDVGYYLVPGMALMSAQARSLGFSMVYASQDIPSMKRLNEREASSIIANTNTKIFMRTESHETGQLAVESAGKRAAPFEHLDASSPDKIKFTDLKSQNEGAMHILYQDRVVRGQSFYAMNGAMTQIRSQKNLRVNNLACLDWGDSDQDTPALILEGVA